MVGRLHVQSSFAFSSTLAGALSGATTALAPPSGISAATLSSTALSSAVASGPDSYSSSRHVTRAPSLSRRCWTSVSEKEGICREDGQGK
jgi:hypothetical protein